MHYLNPGGHLGGTEERDLLRDGVEMTTELRIAKHFASAGTRERGIKFYPLLREAVRSAPPSQAIVVSFEDLEFVSTSFLEETVLKLLSEDRELANRLRITGLPPFASERLRTVLSKMSHDPAIVEGERALKFA